MKAICFAAGIERMERYKSGGGEADIGKPRQAGRLLDKSLREENVTGGGSNGGVVRARHENGQTLQEVIVDPLKWWWG